MNPACTSADCDLVPISNQEWEEDSAVTPTLRGRHLASHQLLEDKEEKEYQGGNDADLTLSGRVDGKSIKVYELDADTGIEECAELEEACLFMLGDMPWEDIQLQFGSPQISGNFVSGIRLRYNVGSHN
jgi:hypothetical protein